MANTISTTPLVKQYQEMKRKHPDAILLFRVGDFYETFSDDAVSCSELLGITLTRRVNGKVGNYIELAGFPHHALDTYLPKLVRAGKRVAICEQIHSPLIQKKLGTSAVTELVTPAKAEVNKPTSLSTAVENVKTAASELSDWDKPNSKFRQLTLDFDL